MVDIELSTVVHGARPAIRACLPRCKALLLYSCVVNMFEVLNLVLISIESLDLNPCLSSCSSMARHLFKDTIPNMFFSSYKMGEKLFRAILLATITVRVKQGAARC
jgi:hypothetical protein